MSKTDCGGRECRLQLCCWPQHQPVGPRDCAEKHVRQLPWPKYQPGARSGGYGNEWRPRSSVRRAYFSAERCAALMGQVAVPALGRQSMLSRLEAAGEARCAHWFWVGMLSVCRPANPRPAIAVQELQLHPNRRWPAATQSQNHVCLALVIERSHAKSSAHPSKVRSVEAVHRCGIAVQSLRWQAQPITFL